MQGGWRGGQYAPSSNSYSTDKQEEEHDTGSRGVSAAQGTQRAQKPVDETFVSTAGTLMQKNSKQIANEHGIKSCT